MTKQFSNNFLKIFSLPVGLKFKIENFDQFRSRNRPFSARFGPLLALISVRFWTISGSVLVPFLEPLRVAVLSKNTRKTKGFGGIRGA